MKDSRKFWDRMAAGYDSQSGERFADAYRSTIARAQSYLKPGDTLLDFACGTGLTTLPLSGCVAVVHAIDQSPEMVSIATQKAVAQGVENIHFMTGSLYDERLLPGAYDALTAFNVLYFLRDLPAVLERIFTLLKPGGIFLSATDCLGDSHSPLLVLQDLLCRVGVFPYMRRLRGAGLQAEIAAHFTILETENLPATPRSLFIAARRTRGNGRNHLIAGERD